MSLVTSSAEQSVLQRATPDGKCLKGGHGKRGDHLNLSGETACQRVGA